MVESIICVGFIDVWKVIVVLNVNMCIVNIDVYLLRLRFI